MKFCWLATVLVAAIFPPLVTSSEQWNDPTSSQYHIQTDEGPERYFRYQTQSGQYRKEKRLEDGTVIGTYAWIDSDGMLRLRDYIADNAGYRILRSKDLYVGAHSPIDQAIKAAKKAPSTSGVLATPNAATPIINFHYSAPTAAYTPQVQIVPNSQYGAKYLPAHVTRLVTTTESPRQISNSPATSEQIVHIPSTTPPPSTYLPSSTPFNIPPAGGYLPSSTPAPEVYSTNQPTYRDYQTTPSNLYAPQQPASTPSPPLASNSLDYTSGYSGDPQYEHYTDGFVNPYIHQNGPTYPIDENGHTFNGHNNKIGNGYDPQYPKYDGVSVTNDGFRYYIPRAYHEEQSQPGGDSKSGSFGYIDPFGIRRVIYYNAGPGTGFQHRKNNRYVGFNATPYDPRPY